MKIIAKTDKGFILDASQNEIARLLGYYSIYTEECGNLKCGDVIMVDAMYEQLYTLKQNESKYTEIATTLKNMVDTLIAVKPLQEFDA